MTADVTFPNLDLDLDLDVDQFSQALSGPCHTVHIEPCALFSWCPDDNGEVKVQV